MPKTKEKTQEENDQEARRINELALQTRNWARRMGAYINPDTGHHGFFTIEEWADNFQEKKSSWGKVKLRLVEINEPIKRAAFGGHYWGIPGDQMSSVALMLKSTATTLENIHRYLSAAQSSGQWEQCRTQLEAMLKGNRHHIDVGDIPKMLAGAGMPMRDDLRRLLLPGSQN